MNAAVAQPQVVPEADRKVYTYKGLCIARANKGPRSWFKLYNVFPDAGGFVQHFPL
jgi:ribosomal protein L19